MYKVYDNISQEKYWLFKDLNTACHFAMVDLADVYKVTEKREYLVMSFADIIRLKSKLKETEVDFFQSLMFYNFTK